MSRTEEVQSIAYKLWEEEGHPQGQDIQHWVIAESMWQNQYKQEFQVVQSDLPKPSAKTRKRTTKK